MTAVVIVESPAKAKTINKYLGSEYKVLASYGHVRNLPKKNGSIDVENDFKPKWEIDTKSKKHIDEIVKALKSSSKLILATDPDREGEAISWHILEILKPKKIAYLQEKILNQKLQQKSLKENDYYIVIHIARMKY